MKAMTLKLLNDKYGIEEEDFLSAELEIVPAGKRVSLVWMPRDSAYGQDNQCMRIHFSCRNSGGGTRRRHSCCLLVDKDTYLQCFADRPTLFMAGLNNWACVSTIPHSS